MKKAHAWKALLDRTHQSVNNPDMLSQDQQVTVHKGNNVVTNKNKFNREFFKVKRPTSSQYKQGMRVKVLNKRTGRTNKGIEGNNGDNLTTGPSSPNSRFTHLVAKVDLSCKEPALWSGKYFIYS